MKIENTKKNRNETKGWFLKKDQQNGQNFSFTNQGKKRSQISKIRNKRGETLLTTLQKQKEI